MKKCVILSAVALFLACPFVWTIPSSQAQTKAEKEFKELHQKEVTPFINNCTKCHTIQVKIRDKKMEKTFMEKCSQCHSLSRLFSKKRSAEEWDQVLKRMAGKPHANISEKELNDIQKWIDFMRAIP